MHLPDDTIVALSTPLGPAPRAVLRISGPAALSLAESLLSPADGDSPLAELAGREQKSAHLDFDGLSVRAQITVFRKPQSFTGDDLVEISLPGSLPLVSWLIARALQGHTDARLALAGEFTLRAFLNGKLDLTQVEAVGRLIHAGGEAEARAAYRQVGGALRDRVLEQVDAVSELLALVEAGIDFPDEEIPSIAPPVLLRRLDSIQTSLAGLLDSTELRIPERGAVRVALLGYPNAGKSSLLNAMAQSARALVSEQAGTTRDPVRGLSSHAGLRLEWVDLAGLAEATWLLDGSPTEKGDGIARAIQRISDRELESADVQLWLLDGDSDLDAERASPLYLDDYKALSPERRILAINKIDLCGAGARERLRKLAPDATLISTRSGEGLGELLERIRKHVRTGSQTRRRSDAVGEDDGVFLISPLQETRLRECSRALNQARSTLLEHAGNELTAVDLREALQSLEPLTGREVSENVLGAIFGQFCIGK